MPTTDSKVTACVWKVSESEHVCIWGEVWTEPVEVCECASHSQSEAIWAEGSVLDQQQREPAGSQSPLPLRRNSHRHGVTALPTERPLRSTSHDLQHTVHSFHWRSHSNCVRLQLCCRLTMKTTWWRCRWKVRLAHHFGPSMPLTTSQLVRLCCPHWTWYYRQHCHSS